MPPRPNMPPGATGLSSNGASSSNNVTLEALINAPARQDQPHLHPQKVNGALWYDFSNFMGPWWNWSTVPQNKKDEWWQDFVQNYYWDKVHHNLVYSKWKTEVLDSVCDWISSKKRDNIKPKYISQVDWDWMVVNWATEEMVEKSKTNTKNRLSNPDGKGIHKHCAGPVAFANIEYNLKLKSGKDEPVPYTDLLRQTHMRKDRTYVDYRAKSIVEEVELTVSQLEAADGSPLPSHTHLINQTFLEINKPKKGCNYGLGSAQDKDVSPNETSHLTRNLDVDMRLSSLETNVEAVKADLAMLKENVMMLKDDMKVVKECAASMKASTHVILRGIGIDPITHKWITPSSSRPMVSESVPASTSLQPQNNNNEE
ncbi:PREDICTED: uncharacterized protein LOC104734025 [Camelina sativa]|uniref:Uncharacterized protein LOC104734025 n=1 Tax=Camelina sativa TaxID=90675 RepID=A0ABM0V6V8_CAMSA|nr:PREDICTED: uncharacterized protein LOC104734025 [Camelina sativa]